MTMKVRDIRRLVKAGEYYDKIVELLDKAYDSVEDGPEERICNGQMTTCQLVRDMLRDAAENRDWIKAKAKLLMSGEL